MIKKPLILLLLILVLAAFLRFWQLGRVPISPDWDEAALGYNAYSLLNIGRDEYGKFLPLILRSFDDYKPAVYAYLAILPVKIFGLNLWAVRLPSAIMGILAVLFVYFLVSELFEKSAIRNHLAVISSLLLAISPWHLQFSRAAFESSVGMAIDILVVWLFMKGLKKPFWLVVSAFFAGLNFYVYQAEKIFTPLLMLGLLIIFRNQIKKMPRRVLVLPIITGLIVILPFIKLTLTTPEIFLRAKGTSFASDQTVYLSRTVQKLIKDTANNDYLGLTLNNRRVTYCLSFLSGYLSHFNLNWLFISGDDARHHAPGMALMYLIELPFFLLGIYRLLFDKNDSSTKKVIFLWFLLAPLPAAFTSGVPHAVRALRFLPVVQIFTAIGLVSFWQTIKKQKLVLKLPITFGLLMFFIFNFAYYFNQYYRQLNYFTSKVWQYGYEPAIAEVKKIESKYDQIIVSNQPYLDQSYMFFLYYLQYPPQAYQKEGGTISGGFAEDRNSFGKYVFRPINWDREEKNEKILYIGRVSDFPGDKPVVKTINFLDGTPAIKLVEKR